MLIYKAYGRRIITNIRLSEFSQAREIAFYQNQKQKQNQNITFSNFDTSAPSKELRESTDVTVGKSNYVSADNPEKLKYTGLITVYEDDKVLIQIANKNKTNMSLEELEALGWLRQVTIYNKTTKSYTIIDNVDMVESFYNTFTKFLEQHDHKIEDFINYAKSKLHSNLFDLLLEEMGWKVSYQEWIDESDIHKESRSANDSKINEDKLTLLQMLSVNASCDFKANHTIIEMKNGFIQTKGNAVPQKAESVGLDGLNKLVLKAYEQNILYT